MTDLSAAARLITPELAGAAELTRQLGAGEITLAQYRIAYQAVVGQAEDRARCDICGAAAYVGTRCAAHTKKEAMEQAGRAHAQNRPVVDICRCPDRERLIATVAAALRAAGLYRRAGRWAGRAAQAPGMDALVQIARDFVRIERSL